MAPEPKITDADLARLRHLSDDGWTNQDLAEVFGVSAQHVGRLLRGEQRATIAALAETARAGVLAAVEQLVGDQELGASDLVLAATARALAAKLDSAAASDSAAAAAATPRLAAALVSVLGELRDGVPHEPDGLDRLKQRREARRLAMAMNGGKGAAA